MTAELALSRLHFPVTTLGPGRRLGIWLQGCSIRCPGCISMDTWAVERATVPVGEVLDTADRWRDAIEGVTVTGGEPLDQPEGLHALLVGLRDSLPASADVLLFTGYSFDQVRPWLEARPGLVDAVVAGPYVQSQPDQLPLRGSDNQTLMGLTARGRQRYAELDRPGPSRRKRLDLMADADGTIWLAGIPRRGDLDRLRAVLARRGTSIVTSQQPPTRCPTGGDER